MVADLGDDQLAHRVPGAVALHFKRMESLGDRLRYAGGPVRAKIVRNKNSHLKVWNDDNDYVREILSLNDVRGSNIKVLK